VWENRRTCLETGLVAGCKVLGQRWPDVRCSAIQFETATATPSTPTAVSPAISFVEGKGLREVHCRELGRSARPRGSSRRRQGERFVLQPPGYRAQPAFCFASRVPEIAASQRVPVKLHPGTPSMPTIIKHMVRAKTGLRLVPKNAFWIPSQQEA